MKNTRERKTPPEGPMSWKRFFDQLEDIIILLDQQGLIVHANRVMETWTGIKAPSLRGKPLAELSGGFSSPGEFLRFFREAGTLPYWEGPWELRIPGGTALTGRALILRHPGSRDRSEYCFILKEMARVPEAAGQRHHPSVPDPAVSGMVHDLNNFLYPILGFCEFLLEDPGLSPVNRQKVFSMFQAGMSARELISRMLNREGKPDAIPINLSIHEVLNDILAVFEGMKKPDILIRTDLTGDQPLLQARRVELEQILMNLLVNAQEALGDQGTIVLRTRISRPAGVFRCRKPLVEIAVSDNGPGMDRITRNRIFQPHFSTKTSGIRGIGLSNVRTLVNNMEGRIQVDSKPDNGTTFRIFLPLSSGF